MRFKRIVPVDEQMKIRTRIGMHHELMLPTKIILKVVYLQKFHVFFEYLDNG